MQQSEFIDFGSAKENPAFAVSQKNSTETGAVHGYSGRNISQLTSGQNSPNKCTTQTAANSTQAANHNSTATSPNTTLEQSSVTPRVRITKRRLQRMEEQLASENVMRLGHDYAVSEQPFSKIKQQVPTLGVEQQEELNDLIDVLEAFSLTMLLQARSTTRKLALIIANEIDTLIKTLALLCSYTSLRSSDSTLFQVLHCDAMSTFSCVEESIGPLNLKRTTSTTSLSNMTIRTSNSFLPIRKGTYSSSNRLSGISSSDKYNTASSPEEILRAFLLNAPTQLENVDPWLTFLCTLIKQHITSPVMLPVLRLAWAFALRSILSDDVVDWNYAHRSSSKLKHGPRLHEEAVLCFRALVHFLFMLSGCARPGDCDRAVCLIQEHISKKPNNNELHNDVPVHAQGFFQFATAFLKCEQEEVRTIIADAVSLTPPTVYPYLLSAVDVYHKVAFDLKSESLRKRKRRDILRLDLVRLHESVAVSAAQCCLQGISLDEIVPSLKSFITKTLNHLSINGIGSTASWRKIRTHFCKFVTTLLDILHDDKSFFANFFTDNLRMDLFSLFVKFTPWTCDAPFLEALRNQGHTSTHGRYQRALYQITDTSEAADLSTRIDSTGSSVQSSEFPQTTRTDTSVFSSNFSAIPGTAFRRIHPNNSVVDPASRPNLGVESLNNNSTSNCAPTSSVILGQLPNQLYSGNQHQSVSHDQKGVHLPTSSRVVENSSLEVAATQALAALCRGPIFDEKAALDQPGYLKQLWLCVLSLGGIEYAKIGQFALEHFLREERVRQHAATWVLDLCYLGPCDAVRTHAFFALATVYIELYQSTEDSCAKLAATTATAAISVGSDTLLTLPEALCVSLQGFVDTRPVTRQLAYHFFRTVCRHHLLQFDKHLQLLTAESCSTQIHYETLMRVCSILLEQYPQISSAMVFELTKRIDNCDTTVRGVLLQLIRPWLAKLATNTLVEQTCLSTTAAEMIQTVIIKNLVCLHSRFGECMHSEFSSIWYSIAHRSQLLLHILDFLLQEGLMRREKNYLDCARSIVIHIMAVQPQRTLRMLLHQACVAEPAFPGRIEQVPTLHSRSDDVKHEAQYSKQTGSTSFWSNHLNSQSHNSSTLQVQQQQLSSQNQQNERLKGILYQRESTSNENDNLFKSSAAMQKDHHLCSFKSGFHQPKEHVTDVRDAKVEQRFVQSKDCTGQSHQFIRQFFLHGIHVYQLNLDEDLPKSNNAVNDGYNIALILLLEALEHSSEYEHWLPHLPALVNTCIITFDHPDSVIHQHAKRLLSHIFTLFAIKQPHENGDNYKQNVRTATKMSTKPYLGCSNEILFRCLSTSGPAWPYEDILPKTPIISSETILHSCVQSLCELLAPAHDQQLEVINGDTFLNKWFNEAFHRATTSSNRHHASRAFQIIRSLDASFSETAINVMLMRLADVVESPGVEAQGYALDVLYTLKKVVMVSKQREHMSPSSIYPVLARIFWTCVCLLESTFMHEFEMATAIIEDILQVTIFFTAQCQSLVSCVFGELNWKHFPGVHELLLKGLMSDKLVCQVLPVISLLSKHLNDPTMDQRNSLCINIVSQLPHLFTHFSETDRDELSTSAAHRLADALHKHSSRLARVLQLYATHEYTKSKDAWLTDFARFYSNKFFPERDVDVISFLISLLERGPNEYHKAIVSILAALLQTLKGRKVGNIGRFAEDIISLIVRLQRKGMWNEVFNLIDATSFLGPEEFAFTQCHESGDVCSSPLPVDMDMESHKFSDTVVGTCGAVALQNTWQDDSNTKPPLCARLRLSHLLRTCSKELLSSSQSVVFATQSSAASHPSLTRDLADASTTSPMIYDDGHGTHINESLVGEDELVAECFTDFDFLDRELMDENDRGRKEQEQPQENELQTSGHKSFDGHPHLMCQANTDGDLVSDDSGNEVGKSKRYFHINSSGSLGQQRIPNPINASLTLVDSKNWPTEEMTKTCFEAHTQTGHLSDEDVTLGVLLEQNGKHPTASQRSMSLSPRLVGRKPSWTVSDCAVDGKQTRPPFSFEQAKALLSSWSLNSSTKSLDCIDSGSVSSLVPSTGPDSDQSFHCHGSVYFKIPDCEIESEWQRHVVSALGDGTGRVLVHTFVIFQQLYDYIVSTHTNLVRVCQSFVIDQLPNTDLSPVFQTFKGLVDINLPFVYVDVEAMASAHLIHIHKSYIIQLHELWEIISLKHVELYKATSDLNFLQKSSTSKNRSRRSSSVSDHESNLAHTQAKLMVIAMCKLHIFMTMSLSVFCQLVRTVEAIDRYPLMHNMSAEMEAIIPLLNEALQHQPSVTSHFDCSKLSKQQAVQSLESHLESKHIQQALSLLDGTYAQMKSYPVLVNCYTFLFIPPPKKKNKP